MNGQVGEWAVAFHGVTRPASCFFSIMSGLSAGEMLKAGAGQQCSNYPAVNNAAELVGEGVYFSPHFQVCLKGYSRSIKVNEKNYYMVLQCRVNPRKIKIVKGREDYWVVNESKDIRPYGVVLFKEEDKKEILEKGYCF